MKPVTLEKIRKDKVNSEAGEGNGSSNSNSSKNGSNNDHSTHSASFRDSHGTGLNENLSLNFEATNAYNDDFDSLSLTHGNTGLQEDNAQAFSHGNVLDDLSYADFEGKVDLSKRTGDGFDDHKYVDQVPLQPEAKVGGQAISYPTKEAATDTSGERHRRINYTDQVPSQPEAADKGGIIQSDPIRSTGRGIQPQALEQIPSQLESVASRAELEQFESATHSHATSEVPHSHYSDLIPSQPVPPEVGADLESFKSASHSHSTSVARQPIEELQSDTGEAQTARAQEASSVVDKDDVDEEFAIDDEPLERRKVDSLARPTDNLPSDEDGKGDKLNIALPDADAEFSVGEAAATNPFHTKTRAFTSGPIPEKIDSEPDAAPGESSSHHFNEHSWAHSVVESREASDQSRSKSKSPQRTNSKMSRIPRPMSYSPGRRPHAAVGSIHSSHLSNISIDSGDGSDLDATSAATTSSNVSITVAQPLSHYSRSAKTGQSSRRTSVERESRPGSRLEGIRKRHEQRRERLAEEQLSSENSKLRNELLQLRLVSDTQANEVTRLANECARLSKEREASCDERELLLSKLSIYESQLGVEKGKPDADRKPIKLSDALSGPSGERLAKESFDVLKHEIAEQESLISGYQKENERLVSQLKKHQTERKDLEKTWTAQLDALLVENSQLRNQVAGFDVTLRQEVEKAKQLMHRTSPSRGLVEHVKSATVDQDTSISGISDADTESLSHYRQNSAKLRADKVRLEKAMAALKAERDKSVKAEQALREKVEHLTREVYSYRKASNAENVARPASSTGELGTQTADSEMASLQRPSAPSEVEELVKDYQTQISDLKDQIKLLQERLKHREAAHAVNLKPNSASLIPAPKRAVAPVARSTTLVTASISGTLSERARLKTLEKTLELFANSCKSRFGTTTQSLLLTAKKQAQELLRSNQLDLTIEEKKEELQDELNELRLELEKSRVGNEAALSALKQDFSSQRHRLEERAKLAESQLEELQRSSEHAIQQDRFWARLDELAELISPTKLDEPIVKNIFAQLRKDVSRMYLEATVIQKEATLKVKQREATIAELEQDIASKSSQWTFELRQALEKLQKENEYYKSRAEVMQQVRDSVQEQALKMLQQTQAELSKASQLQSERALELLKHELHEQANALAEAKSASFVDQLRVSESRRQELESRCESLRMLQQDLRESLRSQEREWASNSAILREENQQLRDSLRRARLEQPPDTRAFGELVDKLSQLEGSLWKRKVEEDRLREALSKVASAIPQVGNESFSLDDSETLSVGGLAGIPLAAEGDSSSALLSGKDTEQFREELQRVLASVRELGLGDY